MSLSARFTKAIARKAAQEYFTLTTLADSGLTGHSHPHRAQPSCIATPETLDMPLSNPSLQYRGPEYRTPDYAVTVLDRALVCSSNNVVMTPGKGVIRESISTSQMTSWLKLRPAHLLPPGERVGHATLLRSCSNNFYHTLIDNAARLFGLWSDVCREMEQITVLVGGTMDDCERYLLERILPPNAVVREVPPGRVIEVENYVFLPFLTRQYVGYLPPEVLEFFESRLSPARPRNRSQRIFISRAKAGKRRIVNEPEIGALAAKHGFETYHLEELSLEQQIELFHDAEAVLGMHGAGFTNLAHTRGARVLEIFPRDRVKPNYYYLARACGGTYDYFCGPGQTMSDDAELEPARVEAWLDRALATASA